MSLSRRGGALLFLLACGCARGCDDQHVARIDMIAERVERDRESALGRWESAPIGAKLAMGDGLRTGARARAELELSPTGRLIVQQSTTLRFERSAPGQARSIELQTGAVEIETATAEVVLTTESGTARIEKGARLRVRREQRGATRFDVALGKVLLERDGESRELAAGEQYDLLVGKALIEPSPPPEPPPPPPSSVPDAGAAPFPATDDASLRFEAPPPFVELSMPAGDSATVHDPKPPTRLELRSAACPGELALETTRGSFDAIEHRVRGQGRGALLLPAGRHTYRVRCFERGRLSDRVVAHGKLIVVRDAGEARLPGRAPAATVDADGRRYTVRYQNTLPVLTLRWPSAPAAERYLLELRPERGPPRMRSLPAPTATLPGGELGEGTHVFRFSAGPARSPEGTLRIEFDHAARIAYLSEPRDRSFVAGAAVRLRGAAIARAVVELNGSAVPVDAQGRFDLRTAVGPGVHALAVRVHSPGSGVHYFLRRVADVLR